MHTDIDKKLMLKFLESNYPVSRIKDNKKFKRAIIMDNGKIFYLSDLNNYNQLKHLIKETLRLIFCFDDAIINSIVDFYLPKK
jgi:hypothetical protein